MFLFLRRPLRLGSRGARDHSSTPPKPSRIGPDVYSCAGVCQNAAHTQRGNLDAWLAKAVASQIPEFQSFVLGIERDKAAVQAGLTRPESNGIVEGKVNKLKLIKRMGYGRAGFPLLRQRVLHAL